MTVYSDNAHRFASRDRTTTAGLILNAADRDATARLDAGCREAIGILRLGRLHDDKWASRDALLTLATAQTTAANILTTAQAKAERIRGRAS